jgi:regulator of RNase E activity RraA
LQIEPNTQKSFFLNVSCQKLAMPVEPNDYISADEDGIIISTKEHGYIQAATSVEFLSTNSLKKYRLA